MYKLNLEKAENQRSTCQHPLDHRKKQNNSRKASTSAKSFNCVNHNKQWKILQEMGISDHLTCLLQNLYAAQEATVRTGHGIMDWFQIGTGVHQSCILSSCLFNLYAKYIMQNAGLDEAQAGIKIARRNISHLRYSDDTSLMAEREEELKSLLMKVKEKSENSWLKTQHSKNQDHGIQSHHFMANRWINKWRQWQTFILEGYKTTADGDWCHEIKRYLLLGKKAMTNLEY